MALGNFYAATGKPEEAEKNFLTSVELAPKSVPIRLHLGNFYLAWGKKDKAEASFKKAVDKDSKNIQALARLAELLHHGEAATIEGLKKTEDIIKINPKSYEGLLLKGRIYLKQEPVHGGQNLFQVYLKDNPKAPMGYYLLALAHMGNRIHSRRKCTGRSDKTESQNGRSRGCCWPISYLGKAPKIRPWMRQCDPERFSPPICRLIWSWAMPTL